MVYGLNVSEISDFVLLLRDYLVGPYVTGSEISGKSFNAAGLRY